MKQLLESISKISARFSIKKIFNNYTSNSNNKVELHFHSPVKFIDKRPKQIKDKN